MRSHPGRHASGLEGAPIFLFYGEGNSGAPRLIANDTGGEVHFKLVPHPDATPVGQMCCFLMSDMASMTTGEMIHVDGGYHAIGA